MLSQVRAEGERESRCQLISLGRWYTRMEPALMNSPWATEKYNPYNQGKQFFMLSLSILFLPTFGSHERKRTVANISIYWWFSKYLTKEKADTFPLDFSATSYHIRKNNPFSNWNWPCYERAFAFLVSIIWSQQTSVPVSNIVMGFFCKSAIFTLICGSTSVFSNARISLKMCMHKTHINVINFNNKE